MNQILFNLLMRKMVSPYNQFKQESKNIGTFIIENIEMNVQVEEGNQLNLYQTRQTACLQTGICIVTSYLQYTEW